MLGISGHGLEQQALPAGRPGCSAFGQVALSGGRCPSVLLPDAEMVLGSSGNPETQADGERRT